MSSSPIFCAIDRPDPAGALTLARSLNGVVGGVKLGLEFFCASGPAGVRTVQEAGLPIFLDLKLHDIPNTVAGAVRSALALEPAMLTLHASGGAAMLRAAVEAKRQAGSSTWLLAVTVLTSLDDADLAEAGVAGGTGAQVERLARLAVEAGIDGLVCSPHEIARLRRILPAGVKLVVPGIRPAGPAGDDQKRVMTPQEALAAGADLLVVGRPITGAADPAAAARALLGNGPGR
ncbi:MAG TPA: orotidine-5'-phosphate decarboxylase [Geminicoccus sp.]|uniref:orotidine-5'-phosphate decarboxylase n=1 Tax=Geminicoccus sp. TaxID=2024832 RepID=UPI002CD815F5|nr:orotidine-5'-phosphate decarboxylase [Geminicoccus sp.]HWL67277.1 orotidine-5'-phosphate decarboxylase [Geminicoccus sp.]